VQVEVDEERPLAALREADGEVGRDDGLARTALRREDGEDVRVARRRVHGVRPAGAHGARLCGRDAERLRRLGQDEHVVDAEAERLAEPARVAVGDGDDGGRCHVGEERPKLGRDVGVGSDVPDHDLRIVVDDRDHPRALEAVAQVAVVGVERDANRVRVHR
jgi:hypothetical protein